METKQVMTGSPTSRTIKPRLLFVRHLRDTVGQDNHAPAAWRVKAVAKLRDARGDTLTDARRPYTCGGHWRYAIHHADCQS